MSAPAIVHQSVKPKLRGIPHALGALIAIPSVVACVLHAAPGTAAIAAATYGASLVFLLTMSAVYHTPQWSPRARMWLRRLDHAAIFVLIAGTYTPVCAVGLPDDTGRTLLLACWGCAALGVLFAVAWPSAPRALNVALYVAMGWMILPYTGTLATAVGTTCGVLLVAGGLLYSLGGVAYARKRPNPVPNVFGYHEVFHSLVLLAVGCHYTVVWTIVG